MSAEIHPEQPKFEEKIVPDRFAGKTAIVTGAGSGIGLAVALRVAREGGRVIAADWDGSRLEALKEQHPDLGFVTVQGDIGDQADVDRIVAACDGRCDGLVNNAGIMDSFHPVGEVTDEIWERVFRVNVWGLMRMTRAVLPLMLEAGKGTIVNTASMAGIVGGAAGAAYTASKHAVVGITKNTAFMYAPNNIRVNAIAPGAVMTNIGADFASNLALARIGPRMQIVVPPPAQPQELAATITFLLSDDSPNVTGAILPSDGGWSAG
jgi:NAD(P)-dependent dehydrogenase (short-subunit alcohol dehydrogenase family)